MRSNDSSRRPNSEPDLIAHLQAAIEATFQMIVLPFEGVTSAPAEEPTARVRATIRFEGDLEGHVRIHCCLGAAQDISRGLLMLEEGDPPLELDEVKDAVGECVNMVAGVLKRDAFDACGEVRMSVPEVELTEGALDVDEGEAQVAYRLDRGISAAEVCVRPAA